jgi:hypothetical protein
MENSYDLGHGKWICEILSAEVFWWHLVALVGHKRLNVAMYGHLQSCGLESPASWKTGEVYTLLFMFWSTRGKLGDAGCRIFRCGDYDGILKPGSR